MAQFFDLHSHMLCGVDDGAKTPEEMFAMLEAAYEDGVRAICLTPHYSPYLFGDTLKSSAKSFAVLREYVARNHPDMRLFLGHELGYHHGCLHALGDGTCRTIAGTRYVLMDFPETVDFFELRNAVSQLQREGYFVILAHTERYRCLFGKLSWIQEFVETGGVVQVNASSVNAGWGKACAGQAKKLIRKGLVHLISSDAHNMTSRPPQMSVCMGFLQKHCDPQTVRDLTWNHACRIVRDEVI